MNYTKDDLSLANDTLEYIRKRPKMFVRTISGVELATAIVGGACLLTQKPVTVIHQEPWWIIGSEGDWLETQTGASVQDFFFRIVAFREPGPNSMHGEVLLSAFATDVVTQSVTGSWIVKGTVSPADPVWDFIRTHPEWKRVVAFRLTD
jgi:hypothetical protein